jgi:hypothetical protein
MEALVNRKNPAAWWKSASLMLAALAALLVVTPAHAIGRVVWKATTVQERTSNESWRLELEIHLPKPPDIAHKSMKFEFTQTAEFERSLVDGKDAPETRTVPLTNQQAIIESQTVGFLDPGTGQTQARTKFSFKVTRAHGYKAGTWKVKIKDGDTDQLIGQETTLTLQGENPAVDRRSIVFHGGSGKKKENGESSAPASNGDEASATSSSSAPEESSSDEPYDAPPEDEGQVPPSVKEKPGGGCHYVPRPSEPLWFLLGLGVGALVLTRRRS